MADVTTKTFPQLLQGIAAAVQSSASGLLDFTEGSINLAVAEAFSGVVLWLQANLLALLKATRAQTSVGPDLDSWIADWASGPTASDATLLTRFPAIGATGAVTFSRLSTSLQVVVPVDPTGVSQTTVSTQDGSQAYAVTIDTTNPAYNAALGGYVMAAGIGTVTVPVKAVNTGSATNAVAGAINTITSAIPGVDSVTNSSAFTNGFDAETDGQYLTRFRSFILSLREATPAALANAIKALQRGVQCVIVENANHDGTSNPGFFYFVVDDGTGAPPTPLLNAAGAAVDAHRAAGGNGFGIYAPVIVPVAVSAIIGYVAGLSAATQASAKAAVVLAVQNYLNTLPLNAPVVSVSRIDQVMHDASPYVQTVTSLTLNSGSTDIALTANQLAKAGAVTLTP
jgi:uncharacterized phage protein gp47/JayE